MSHTPSPFDVPVERRGSDSLKWQRYAGKDILPMWVADMDFAAPPCVMEALQKRVAHGVFGYGHTTAEFLQAVTGAMRRDYGWEVESRWIVPLAGLVSGLNIACAAVGDAGAGIVTAAPVYPPFLSAPANMQRRLRRVELDGENDWGWDLAGLQQGHEAGTRGLLLCHPHNPVGRVWSDSTLNGLANYAKEHDLVVISDEIHCDLILEPGLRHKPFAMLPEMAARTITLMAPSKTYNIPGLGAAFAIIPDAALRARFEKVMNGIVPHQNLLGMVATTAAYQDGAGWRSELLDYLRANRELVMQLDGFAGLRVHKPEATYLAWLDCRGTVIGGEPQRFFEEAGVGLSAGKDFGREGFVRLNFGCTRATLTEALERIRRALSSA